MKKKLVVILLVLFSISILGQTSTITATKTKTIAHEKLYDYPPFTTTFNTDATWDIGTSVSGGSNKIYDYWCSAYKVSLSDVPAGYTIKRVTMKVLVSKCDYYSDSFQVKIGQLDNGISLTDLQNLMGTTADQGNFGNLSVSNYDDTVTVDISSVIGQRQLTDQYFIIGACSSDGNNNSHAQISITVSIEYYLPLTLTADNNFTTSDNKHGQIIVNNTQGSAPSQLSNLTVNSSSFSLQAVSPQTDNLGYQRVWNTSGVTASLSYWNRKVNTSYTNISNNIQISRTVAGDDWNATYTAYLMKKYNVTFQNSLDNGGNGGTIKVNSTSYSSPASGFSIVEQNPVPVQALDQTISGTAYYFHHWSNGSTGATNTFYPTDNTTYTATLISKDALASDGPSAIVYGSGTSPVYTWTANVSLGFPPYTYQWYYMYPNPNNLLVKSNIVKPNLLPYNTWYALGSSLGGNTATLTTTFVQQARIKCVVTDSKGLTGTSDIIYIDVTNSKEAGNPYGNIASGQLASEQSTEVSSVNSYGLEQNSPNPFNPSTIISYQLPNDGFVSLKIYDMLGREVKTLVNDIKTKGKYSVSFDASKLASGIYIYRLKANGFSSIKR